MTRDQQRRRDAAAKAAAEHRKEREELQEALRDQQSRTYKFQTDLATSQSRVRTLEYQVSVLGHDRDQARRMVVETQAALKALARIVGRNGNFFPG